METWETSNTITVCEDWDNAELQNITEGGVVDGEPEEESAIYPGMLNAENTTDHEKSSANEHGSLVADNITGVDSEMNADNASEAAGLVFDEETPVLVPGLNQILVVESEPEVTA